MKTKVAIQKCGTYDPVEIQNAVEKAVADAGGLNMIRSGDRVLLKINLLNTAPPERAVTTHPEVTRAMIRAVKDLGGKPIVGDAPGLDLPGMGKKVLRTSGTLAVCEQEDVPAIVFTDKGYKQVQVETNVKIKQMYIARELLEADVVIGLSKAKSHMQAIYTGAIKNFFGAVPTKDRKFSHAMPGLDEFAQCLVDIFIACNPHFGLMDAVIAMEGRGPSDGKPRNLGLILASNDLVALDTATSTAMGYDRTDIPHIRLASRRLVGVGDIEKIEIVGPALKEVRQEFELPPTSKIPVPGFLNAIAVRLIKVDPRVTPLCIKCGHCAEVCPVDAIVMGDNMAVIDYGKCIGCFCCHELCPSSAIKEKTSLAIKLFRFFTRLKEKKRAKIKS